MLLKLKKRFRKDKDIVNIGGKAIKVTPLGLEAAMDLTLVIGPYIPLLERVWPEFQTALARSNGKRPEVLSALLKTLATEMQQAPGDIVKIVSLLIDEPIEWVAENATGAEILGALPTFDRVNHFDQILHVMQQSVRIDNG